MWFGYQCLLSTFFQGFLPAEHRRRPGAYQACHLSNALALLEQPAGDLATNFQRFCTTFWPHTAIIHETYMVSFVTFNKLM